MEVRSTITISYDAVTGATNYNGPNPTLAMGMLAAARDFYEGLLGEQMQQETGVPLGSGQTVEITFDSEDGQIGCNPDVNAVVALGMIAIAVEGFMTGVRLELMKNLALQEAAKQARPSSIFRPGQA